MKALLKLACIFALTLSAAVSQADANQDAKAQLIAGVTAAIGEGVEVKFEPIQGGGSSIIKAEKLNMETLSCATDGSIAECYVGIHASDVCATQTYSFTFTMSAQTIPAKITEAHGIKIPCQL